VLKYTAKGDFEMEKMQKSNKITLIWAVCFLSAFAAWTWLVRFVDVQPIGPHGSSVGFATFNGFIHGLLGVNMSLYVITDWLGLVPIAIALGFAILGLCQWINRKSILKVDISILTLGGFYLLVMAVYVLFEYVVINRRPVLIEGYLEASYPSSTTMLVTCVMPAAIMQFGERIKCRTVCRVMTLATCAFIGFMVVGRLLSGVHWVTDIIGGAIFSAGAVMLYRAITDILEWTCGSIIKNN